jgi:pimeloyl-ACP methyl ester carboxylesterase
VTQPRGFSLDSEFQAGAELAALIVDPMFRGRDLPRGDHRPVLVLPGLFGNDLYLGPLHQFLLNIGYRPVISNLALNVGCGDRLTATARANLDLARRGRESSPVAIVGHSRGGMLGWALAGELGAQVSHLVLLGSPAPAIAAGVRAGGAFAGLTSTGPTQFLRGMSDRARARTDPRCTFPACDCVFRSSIERGPSPQTRVLSILSTEDRVVPPQLARIPGGRNLEVRGSHTGLAYNRTALRALAEELAER